MSPSTLRRIRDIIFLTLAGLFLLLAQSAYWLNHNIFDKQNYTSIVTPIITSDASQDAIASTIVDQALADRPVVNRLIGNNVTALVSGLLGTDLAQQMITTLVDRSYTYLTTDNPRSIQIDLLAIKAPLEKITTLLESTGRDVQVDPGAIPDAIVLFEPSGLPDVYGYSILILWLGPLFWISFVFFSALYIYLGRARYARRVYWLGGVIIFASCVGLLVGPLLPPPIVAQVPIPELRGVVSSLINAMLAPFTQQMLTAIAITALVLLVFYLRFAILHGVNWVVKKTADSVSAAKKPSKMKK